MDWLKVTWEESAIDLLRSLIHYNTVNNPSENQFPDLSIIADIQEILLRWNPEYKSKIFESGLEFNIKTVIINTAASGYL